MANKRMITGDFFEDDYFGELDRDIRLLWLGLITSAADDQGRIFNSPALLRAKIFLYDTDIDDDFIVRSVQKLANDGKIVCYVKNGKPLIQIVKWWVYQAPSWASLSKFPAPDAWTDRAKYHTVGNKVEIVNWDKQGGYIADYIAELNSDLTAIDESEVKSESEGDVKCKSESEPVPASAGAVFTAYEHEIGVITPHIAERLKDACDLYPETWLIDAFKIASEKQARNMKYIEAILARWHTEGKDNGTRKPAVAKKPERKVHSGAELAKAWGAK